MAMRREEPPGGDCAHPAAGYSAVGPGTRLPLGDDHLFIALFPGSLLGLEAPRYSPSSPARRGYGVLLLSIAAHAAHGVERSVVSLSSLRWQRFTTFEAPAGMIGLVWNGMMSFGGGGSFLRPAKRSACLTTIIRSRHRLLRGDGGEGGQNGRLGWALLTMALVIIAFDRCSGAVSRWSEKFKLEQSGGRRPARSWMLDLLRSRIASRPPVPGCLMVIVEI